MQLGSYFLRSCSLVNWKTATISLKIYILIDPPKKSISAVWYTVTGEHPLHITTTWSPSTLLSKPPLRYHSYSYNYSAKLADFHRRWALQNIYVFLWVSSRTIIILINFGLHITVHVAKVNFYIKIVRGFELVLWRSKWKTKQSFKKYLIR